MDEGVAALSEREKETLRLLLAGHDAKSMARDLGLSVHTVNERLRDARRKLGTTSSREAARMLADSERDDPKNLGDRNLRVAAPADARAEPGPPTSSTRRDRRLAWVGGGIVMMSLLIVAALIASRAPADGVQVAGSGPAVTTSTQETASAGAGTARNWVALLDAGRWDDAWRAAGALFRAQMPEANWPATIQPVRQPLGAVASRTFLIVTKSHSLPGAPAGDYEVIQFTTRFAAKPGAIETVVMAREGAAWRVDGYFIR